MKKIVINACYGGFGLSDKGLKYFNELGGTDFKHSCDIDRSSVHLVRTVEELKKEADGLFAKLKIVEIPDNVNWGIDEYDGMEWVSERHRIWE